MKIRRRAGAERVGPKPRPKLAAVRERLVDEFDCWFHGFLTKLGVTKAQQHTFAVELVDAMEAFDRDSLGDRDDEPLVARRRVREILEAVRELVGDKGEAATVARERLESAGADLDALEDAVGGAATAALRELAADVADAQSGSPGVVENAAARRLGERLADSWTRAGLELGPYGSWPEFLVRVFLFLEMRTSAGKPMNGAKLARTIAEEHAAVGREARILISRHAGERLDRTGHWQP